MMWPIARRNTNGSLCDGRRRAAASRVRTGRYWDHITQGTYEITTPYDAPIGVGACFIVGAYLVWAGRRLDERGRRFGIYPPQTAVIAGFVFLGVGLLIFVAKVV